MKKYLRVINLDGTEGSGKTTQISMLSAFFTKNKIPFQVNYLEDNQASGIEVAEKTLSYLKSNDLGVVINDGSPARMMVSELAQGIRPNDILTKYKDIVFINEQISHEFGTANLLFVLDDLEEAERRVKRREKLIKGKIDISLNMDLEQDIVSLMRYFDTHSISKGLKFDVIEVYKEESMIDVSEKVMQYLQDNFEIKKPHSDQVGHND